MKSSLFAGALALASLAVPALGNNYYRSDSIVGADFLKAFIFQTMPDPTHGRV
jgi:hypothetical protein